MLSKPAQFGSMSRLKARSRSSASGKEPPKIQSFVQSCLKISLSVACRQMEIICLWSTAPKHCRKRSRKYSGRTPSSSAARCISGETCRTNCRRSTRCELTNAGANTSCDAAGSGKKIQTRAWLQRNHRSSNKDQEFMCHHLQYQSGEIGY